MERDKGKGRKESGGRRKVEKQIKGNLRRTKGEGSGTSQQDT